MDISGDKIFSGDIEECVETSRFGSFTFRVGVDQREFPQRHIAGGIVVPKPRDVLDLDNLLKHGRRSQSPAR